MCSVLKVSRSGFYAWFSRPESQRMEENMYILETIKAIRKEEPKKQSYGALRMLRELTARGIDCGKNRLAAIMAGNGIKAKIKRKFKCTTDSNHNSPIAPNLLKQQFDIDVPNTVYVTDITYIPTGEGWFYLATVLDLFSRKIIGWATSSLLNTELIIDALHKAVKARQPKKGLIVHSDRGCQYASHEYRMLLEHYGFRQSMSGSGNCYDNAVMESFFHTLKTEWVSFHKYKTRVEARTSVFDYIETFYNRERRHSKLNYDSPVTFEKKYFKVA
jgi:putative transposase